jgi:hypothetical protein
MAKNKICEKDINLLKSSVSLSMGYIKNSESLSLEAVGSFLTGKMSYN